MKKNIILTSLFSSLLLLSVGCGGDDKDKTVDPEDVTLDFKTSGDYNLRDYIAPDQNKTINYVEKTYTDKTGKKNYKAIADEELYPIKKFEISGAVIKEYGAGNALETTYTITENKIISQDVGESGIDRVKFANVGDYITKIISTETKQACKINKYIATKEVGANSYTDVLELSCTGTTEAEGIMGGQSNSVSTIFTNKMYLAKNVGEISSIFEKCTTTKLGTLKSTECQKKTTDLTNILD